MAGQGQRARRGSAPGLIQAAAREVFAERGYGATTREIASRAGVSHDLIFRYFDNKEKLFFDAVVTPLLDAVGGLHQRWLDDPTLTAMDHDRLVRRFTAGFYEFMSSNQSIARAMVHVFADESSGDELDHVRARISATLDPIVTPMEQYLSAQGLRTSSPALQLRLLMLFVGVAATFLRNTYPSDKEVPSAEEIIDELSFIISAGLHVSGRPRRPE
ncbi:TetR/AcrR family transcriptional regulator [Mycobacterium sp. E3251]|uniref:TetR/AcrR family transcriptional regulator n=1 Tax=Mycobacterium sp. E3251 TaxID=1834144 RepID=UPI0009ED5DE3|nr:TetR/AcrR family transcriptional regulator [Mycobacterium sp. E3251]